MDQDRWRMIERICNSVLEHGPEDRDAFLQQACAGDEPLRKEVESLLAYRSRAEHFIKRPAVESAAKVLAEDKASEANTELLGNSLLHYRIEEKIGEGGMGVVYRAKDEHLKRDVAIKVLPPELVTDPERRKRFVQEARAASALSHPNIVTIHDIASDAGRDFIAMEYIAGKTLDEIIPRKGIRMGETLKIALQIAAGLAGAHVAGIVHRDLKPANIMVTGDGLVKLLDFGLAKLTEPAHYDPPSATGTTKPRTHEGAILGTVAYMSPEQAEGKPVDARSDIFSFGSVLYEMVTGRRAFQGDSNVGTLSAILHQEPKPLERVPRDFEKIVSRCLRKDPNRRFQHMEDVRVELAELEHESESRPEGAPRVRPAGLLRYVIAAATIAFALVLGWLWLFRREPAFQPARLVHLTSYTGSETSPSFSPDGKQVAFQWNGDKERNWDIYVKRVGETNALRLTTDPLPDYWPSWSPDGSGIAFSRPGPGGMAVYIYSWPGGPERKLFELRNLGPAKSWSPDGKWLAMPRFRTTAATPEDPAGIYIFRVAGGEPRRITFPEHPEVDAYPNFSWDGEVLAFARLAGFSGELYLQQLTGNHLPLGSPKRLTNVGYGIGGLAWNRDDKSIVLSTGRGNAEDRLHLVPVQGESKLEGIELVGVRASRPAVSPSGDRLAFSHAMNDYNIWRYQEEGAPEPFIRSSFEDILPDFSPDGKRIAFDSTRNGKSNEIWTADADGTNLVQITHGPGRNQGAPSWSPDGRRIAFDSQGEDGMFDIYTIESTGGQPRRITSASSNEYQPSWSRDGMWIYFRSDRTGRDELWRIPFAGGTWEQVTTGGGDLAFESCDGGMLYYTIPDGSLFTRPVGGGPEQKLIDFARLGFAVVENGIYYCGPRGEDHKVSLFFYDLSSGSSRLLTRFPHAGGWPMRGLTVSPDRKTLLFTASLRSGSDLMMIENFR
jgi:Tol biopolymer transport system component/predicted Ser/Thr protein kinase